eukprot:CAMPEP_0174378828 /NCGR_PEP_ID=MMETSP0811_2-20130205/122298_1 /TAXON_ID=73025 ORGANISM="Eutreptiella gymnastica-like, Strain CCMP1594" /NCGR_SAMPLE_ID=MMETSP0811_2 /ASSEMBLY_ACC=CAM_ASM_000667 /LENGTH=668 /DNA_ID=CAMNT_0015531147 /DNA_START=29 /DNA_END=2036 /DNA_ORIENTATION=+
MILRLLLWGLALYIPVVAPLGSVGNPVQGTYPMGPPPAAAGDRSQSAGGDPNWSSDKTDHPVIHQIKFNKTEGPFEVPGMGWLFCTFEMKHRQGVKILVRQEGTKGSIDGGLSNKYPLKNVKSPPDMTVWQWHMSFYEGGLTPSMVVKPSDPGFKLGRYVLGFHAYISANMSLRVETFEEDTSGASSGGAWPGQSSGMGAWPGQSSGMGAWPGAPGKTSSGSAIPGMSSSGGAAWPGVPGSSGGGSWPGMPSTGGGDERTDNNGTTTTSTPPTTSMARTPMSLTNRAVPSTGGGDERTDNNRHHDHKHAPHHKHGEDPHEPHQPKYPVKPPGGGWPGVPGSGSGWPGVPGSSGGGWPGEPKTSSSGGGWPGEPTTSSSSGGGWLGMPGKSSGGGAEPVRNAGSAYSGGSQGSWPGQGAAGAENAGQSTGGGAGPDWGRYTQRNELNEVGAERHGHHHDEPAQPKHPNSHDLPKHPNSHDLPKHPNSHDQPKSKPGQNPGGAWPGSGNGWPTGPGATGGGWPGVPGSSGGGWPGVPKTHSSGAGWPGVPGSSGAGWPGAPRSSGGTWPGIPGQSSGEVKPHSGGDADLGRTSDGWRGPWTAERRTGPNEAAEKYVVRPHDNVAFASVWAFLAPAMLVMVVVIPRVLNRRSSSVPVYLPKDDVPTAYGTL